MSVFSPLRIRRGVGVAKICRLHQAPLCHAQCFTCAHNDVIENPNINQCQRVFQGLGKGLIGPAGLHATAGLIVGQHHILVAIQKRTFLAFELGTFATASPPANMDDGDVTLYVGNGLSAFIRLCDLPAP